MLLSHFLIYKGVVTIIEENILKLTKNKLLEDIYYKNQLHERLDI